jgi:CBS-domain-containing membrane protein
MKREENAMKVGDVMTNKVFTATRDMPLRLVAKRMLEYGISGMPVVDGDRVVGVISETDILFKERSAPDRHWPGRLVGALRGGSAGREAGCPNRRGVDDDPGGHDRPWEAGC